MYDKFNQLTAAARAVRNIHGTETQEARDMIFEAVKAANGGVVTPVAIRVATWQAGRGFGTIQVRGKVYQGKGQKAALSARPNAGASARWHIDNSVRRGLESLDIANPSIRRLREFAPVSPTAVRSSLQRVTGQLPPLVAKARAALSEPAQALIKILERHLPKGAMSVVTVAAAQRCLWEPSANASTIRSHRARFKRIVDEVGAAYGVGISVRIVGDDLFVGRGRAIPANLYAWARDNVIVRRKLPDALFEGRAGLWSTRPGIIAQHLVALLEGASTVVNAGLAYLTGCASDEEIAAAREDADAMLEIANQERGPARKNWLARFEQKRAWIAREERDGAEAIARLIAGFNENAGLPGGWGLKGMWKAARTMPGLTTPEMRTKRAQGWMDRIADVFETIPVAEAWKMIFWFEDAMWKGSPRHLRGERPTPRYPVPERQVLPASL